MAPGILDALSTRSTTGKEGQSRGVDRCAEEEEWIVKNMATRGGPRGRREKGAGRRGAMHVGGGKGNTWQDKMSTLKWNCEVKSE